MKKLCCVLLTVLLVLCCASALAEQCKYAGQGSPCEPGWWVDVEKQMHARACFYHVEEKEDMNSHVLITPWENCTLDEGGECTGCGWDYDTSDNVPDEDDYEMYWLEMYYVYTEMMGQSPVEVTESNGKLTIKMSKDFFSFLDDMGVPYTESFMVKTELTLKEVDGVWQVVASEYGPGSWLKKFGKLEIGAVDNGCAEITVDGAKYTLGGSVGGDVGAVYCKYGSADSPCNIIWWLDKDNRVHCRACKNHVEDKEDPYSYVQVTEWTSCTLNEDDVCTGCGWDYSEPEGPSEEDYDAYMTEIYYLLLEKKGVPPLDVTLDGNTLTIKINEQFQMYMLEYGIPVTETLMVGTVYTLDMNAAGDAFAVTASEYGPGAWLERMGLLNISPVKAGNGTMEATVALDGGEDYVLVFKAAGGPTEPEVLSGDADGDGEVGIMDALAILQVAVGWDTSISCDAADVDGDGEVGIMDALLVLQYAVGWDVELK